MKNQKQNKKDEHEHGPEENMLQMRFIESQINQISQELQILDARKQEVDNLAESLDELKHIKKDSSAYAPIGPGVFVKSEIKDTKNLMVNVGSGVIVKKSVEDTKKLLKDQSKQLEDAQKKLSNALQTYYIQAQALQSQLQ